MAKFTLTEAHVRKLYEPVQREGNWSSFLAEIDPNVRWVIAGETKDPVRMTGVYDLASWTEEIAKPLGSHMTGGTVKMTVSFIDVIGNKAILEAYGEATTLKGLPYNNRYAWFFLFSEETGKIVEIREYLDTALVQQVNQAAAA
ncbi:hypothetical protein DFH06DRAFT_978854 [Mycena polygramma]|nr:hypothetical protein DFH06DRAFT_978854 [Mycena polygramma]